MNIDSLNEKKAAIEQQFNNLQDTKKTILDQLRQLDEEALKLSGQFQLLTEQIDGFDIKDDDGLKGKKVSK